MRVHLRPVGDQVIVITGASSGIGLVTARMAAGRGSKVVLASRNEQALRGRIDTPYNDHAQSYVRDKPAHRGMVYPPQAVADAILHAAEHPTRDMFVGGRSRVLALIGAVAPRLTDRMMEPYAYPSQTKGEPSQSREESALWHAGDGLRERGTNAPHVMRAGKPLRPGREGRRRGQADRRRRGAAPHRVRATVAVSR